MLVLLHLFRQIPSLLCSSFMAKPGSHIAYMREMKNGSWLVDPPSDNLLDLRTRTEFHNNRWFLSGYTWGASWDQQLKDLRTLNPKWETLSGYLERGLKGLNITCAKGNRENLWKHTREIFAMTLMSFSPFLDACLPTLFFYSFVHTFLKYLLNTYFRHKPGLARAGVYRRRLFSPLPLNGSSLLLSFPIIQW